jgi:hypothetical protein
MLGAIEPSARLAEREGNTFPLITLRIGIAFHGAIVDVCEEFERAAGKLALEGQPSDQPKAQQRA